jgi:hypothetical protein
MNNSNENRVINNGLLGDIELIPTKDIGMIPGESSIFNNNQELSVKGIQEQTGLSNSFFSSGNTNLLQANIRYDVYEDMNKIIDKQSGNELFTVMRSIYLQHGNPMVTSSGIVEEIQKLNKKVVEYCASAIKIQLEQYGGYIEKITTLPTAPPLPEYHNKANFTYDTSNLM